MQRVCDHRPRNSARYERAESLYSEGKNGHEEIRFATTGFTTEVNHQAASKIRMINLGRETSSSKQFECLAGWQAKPMFRKRQLFRCKVRESVFSEWRSCPRWLWRLQHDFCGWTKSMLFAHDLSRAWDFVVWAVNLCLPLSGGLPTHCSSNFIVSLNLLSLSHSLSLSLSLSTSSSAGPSCHHSECYSRFQRRERDTCQRF